MLEKVYEIVRQSGPVLPVEIATKLKIDSFVAHAYLQQLAEAGKVKAGKERVGNTFLYFTPGQENAAQARANDLLQQTKKTAKQFAKESAPVTSGVAAKRQEFSQRLKEIEEREEKEKKKKFEIKTEREDFIERFKQAITPFLTSREEEPETIEIKPEIQIEEKAPEPIEEEKKVEKEPEPKKTEKPKKPKKKKTIFGSKVDIVELAEAYLTERGAEIISKDVKKKKEANLIVKIPSGIGSVKMFVKIKDKKSINEADLSLTYTQAQNKKLPALFLTTGKLTKTAENYLKVIEGLLKVKFLESEDK